jgi:hypothetical protein
MKERLASPLLCPAPPPAGRAGGFRSLAIQNDVGLAARAMWFCRRVQAEAGGPDPTISCVAFNDLSDPAGAESVALQAADADLVVVAIDWERPVPPTAINWFFTWPEERSRFGGTLLLLSPAPEAGAVLWRGFFDHIAASGGMEFWCEWDGLPLEPVLLRRGSGVWPRARGAPPPSAPPGATAALAGPGG